MHVEVCTKFISEENSNRISEPYMLYACMGFANVREICRERWHWSPVEILGSDERCATVFRRRAQLWLSPM